MKEIRLARNNTMKMKYRSLDKVFLCGVVLLGALWAWPQNLALAALPEIALKKLAKESQPAEADDAEDNSNADTKVEKDIIIKELEPADKTTAPRRDVAWLGVATEEASEALTSQLDLSPGVGLLTTFVSPDSPAAKAGVKKNDVLIELNGQELVHPTQ